MSLWKVAGILVLVFLALGLIGIIIKALRFLVWVAIIVAVIAAIVGAMGRSKRT
ncbi:MAG: hypothetical protein ACRD2W_00900 [Acidimicrobiales bacterium]